MCADTLLRRSRELSGRRSGEVTIDLPATPVIRPTAAKLSRRRSSRRTPGLVVLAAGLAATLPAVSGAGQSGIIEDCAALPGPLEWAADAVDSADTIFLGVVISVVEPPEVDDSEPRPAGSGAMDDLLRKLSNRRSGTSTKNVQIASFEILRAWKEPELPVVRAKNESDPPFAGFRFIVGETYLVVGQKMEDDFYRVDTGCNATLRAVDAEERIEALDTLVPSQ